MLYRMDEAFEAFDETPGRTVGMSIEIWRETCWCVALTVLAVAGMMMVGGCGEDSQRIDVDSEDLSLTAGVSSKDFRTVCYQMSQSLIRLPQIQKAHTPPKIAFTKVTNNSDELLDTDDFLYKMRTELIKNSQGKMLFLDRDMTKQLMDEQMLKDAGERTGHGGTLMGADYFLAGRIESIRHARGRETTNYMRFSFRLTQASTGAIVWEDDYEMKTYHKSGVYDR
jgi:PBP1b-binding outer membrane lipoprotein LpoB